jgi:hypothetical protein
METATTNPTSGEVECVPSDKANMAEPRRVPVVEFRLEVKGASLTGLAWQKRVKIDSISGA